HPFVDNQVDNDTFPGCFIIVNCTDTIFGTVVDYDAQVGNCIDIVKEIVRTHHIRYDKRDFFCTDTIRVQAIDTVMFMCPPERDSVYCHTGYLKDENGNPSPLETGIPMIDSIPIWPQPNSVCDVLVFYEDTNFDGDCPMTIHRVWYVKSTCTEFYATCEQWLMIFDTIGPTLEKDLSKAFLADEDDFGGLGPVIFIPTSTHGCEAHTYVPDVMAYDTCSGVKMVKAKVGDLTTVVLEYNETEEKWESHQNVKIPRSDEPIPVIYEAFDSCHNVTMDTCYFFVKDFTKPVAVCNKGVQVTLSDTLVWVPAEVFDEGSSDNCAISLVLARRSDWATSCGVDLCDDRQLYCTTEHHDSIWCSVLEKDKTINPVEAHYAKTLQWLCEDNQVCNGFIIGGWWYDLIKYGTLDCVDHPYPVDEQYLRSLFEDESLDCTDEISVGYACEKMGFTYDDNIPDFAAPLFSESAGNDFDIVSQIGGGWSKDVPFCCEDACQIVQIELLVMDYWCNWSKCWTDVYVEDKTPPELVTELFDISISCNSYQTFYADAVTQAQAGDFAALDTLLGTYDKVSYDQYRNLPEKTDFTVHDLLCDSVLVTKDSLIYDEHLGYQWKTYSYYRAVFDTVPLNRYNGQIADDCGLVCIQEKPWVSLDECGNGFIKRQFKFVGECFIDPTGHVADTLIKHQTIWINSKCDISKSMFYVPKDVITYDCGIQYEDDGSGTATGAADPALTGYPEYLLDQNCRSIGIGYYDKVFRIVGGDEACYKIIRTWCFADWCAINDGYEVDTDWWFDPEYDGRYISCTQKIILLDSVPPVCTIEAPDEIESPSCLHNLNVPVTVQDECGVLEYTWQLIGKKDDLVLYSGQGELNSADQDQFFVQVDDVEPGIYEIKAVVTDDCQNETKCVKEFEIIQSKRPAAICLSSITAELTPMDSDGDNVVDTAMAIVWASEFNESSSAACGSEDSSLTFLINFAEGEAVLPDPEATNLALGCEHVGTHLVNMYVVDESGAWDFCTVVLVVQSNMGGCAVDGTDGRLVGSLQTEILQPIDHVDVTIQSIAGATMMEALDSKGSYEFQIATGTKAYITPTKNTDFINGVSTRDLIDIQQHILGKEKLDSWYKEQAADASADGKISPVDLILLRKLILAKIDVLPDNTSWRFFDADRSESYHINPMVAEVTVDFIGVKTGDVNLDNDPARRAGRSSRSLVFSAADQTLQAGQKYRIPIRTEEIDDLLGFQFTWQGNGVTITAVEWNEDLDLGAEHFNLDHLADRWFTVAWHSMDANPTTLSNEDVLMWLNLQVDHEVLLSDAMTISSSRTSAEAYLGDLDMDVALQFTDEAIGVEQVQLYQNAPNPFHQTTTIGFYMPEAADVVITIYDVAGRSLRIEEGYVQKGHHEWTIDLSDGPASGVLYYRLESKSGQAIRKMVRMDP
ncbi:MAG: T9SS type A sorting domain-containing protein, partial [Saprospiraceae bacterium]|nr:T9SS type A sorting domain-containing protein [Saprospiraceae bacterium]